MYPVLYFVLRYLYVYVLSSSLLKNHKRKFVFFYFLKNRNTKLQILGSLVFLCIESYGKGGMSCFSHFV